ncbi:MAG: hypothetical protein WCA92_16835, partial [Terriglobales bacterium]
MTRRRATAHSPTADAASQESSRCFAVTAGAIVAKARPVAPVGLIAHGSPTEEDGIPKPYFV